jgi:hypothetical protein
MKVSEILENKTKLAMKRMVGMALVVISLPLIERVFLLDRLLTLLIALVLLITGFLWGKSAIRCQNCSNNLSIFPRGNNMWSIKFCPYCAISMSDEIENPKDTN